MATRAIYTFKDSDQTIHVYKHWDGYPESALKFIANALPFAWPMPRFEADDFAAAFVAANKPAGGGGDVRLMDCGSSVPDVGQEYHYIVTVQGGRLWVSFENEFSPLDELIKKYEDK